MKPIYRSIFFTNWSGLIEKPYTERGLNTSQEYYLESIFITILIVSFKYRSEYLVNILKEGQLYEKIILDSQEGGKLQW